MAYQTSPDSPGLTLKETIDLAASLFTRVDSIIEQGQLFAATQANLAETLTFWRVGHEVRRDLLQEQRADYGKQIVVTLSRQLVAKRGRSYEEKNLRRMMQFAEQFDDEHLVAELGRHLSWSHFLALLPVKTMQAKTFYAQQVTDGRLGVRALRELIHKKTFERCEVANAQLGDGSTIPLDTFRDPYLLDFLGMHNRYQERDLEEAILHDLEAFLLEVGNGLAFIGRQTRMPMGDRDYHLDLLFFSRPLRRLVAVDLKIGEFLPEYMGQMHFYLKWLNRHERGDNEAAPIGLILCTSADRDQIELMELHKDNIVVAQYWTELLPKAELEERIKIILRGAKERLARRELTRDPDKDVLALVAFEPKGAVYT